MNWITAVTKNMSQDFTYLFVSFFHQNDLHIKLREGVNREHVQ